MSIKLVAIDLDDTLLDSRHQISAECSKAIHRAREKGIIVTLATGRMFQAALPYARQLQLDIPLITYQGALVKHSFSGEVLYYRPIPQWIAAEIITHLQKQKINYHLYSEDRLYVEKLTSRTRLYAEVTGIKPWVVPQILSLLQNQEATEIMALVDNVHQLLDLEEQLRGVYGRDLHITRFKDRSLELMDGKATKADALAVIAQHYHIKRQEVMAIGDSYNDLPMIEWAGMGVAMGNAEPEVKGAADFVTFSNEDKGVAEALNRFVLK